ncbi:MAG: multicopper oxidase domain-containing protein, partial [Alphaproteobacteria bacterium]|nr:multicopper oxidase domain-containing protein [Alphaproteobacteria bacterium]
MEHVSRNGVLDVTLVAAAQEVAFDGVRFPGMVYNGRYEGPVLRVRPGDMLRINLVNRLNGPTNLHFHGIETTPRGRGDNIAILVPPGASFDYEVPIPADQPPGMYWYHAHVHGMSVEQVMGGLSGALIVEGAEAMLPQLTGLRERILVLKDY